MCVGRIRCALSRARDALIGWLVTREVCGNCSDMEVSWSGESHELSAWSDRSGRDAALKSTRSSRV